jgi:hypothetical protein
MAEKVERPRRDAKISRNDEDENKLWSTKYGVTKRRLADAIKAVGPAKAKQKGPKRD